jgi:hypothetical protein
MAKKFYAVLKGHKVGIFTTWAACQSSTKGYSGENELQKITGNYRGNYRDTHHNLTVL